MEADWQHYYQLNLVDFHRREITLRRAIVLTMRLPAGAQVWQETGGPLAWTTDHYFLARIFHTGNVANWQRTENGRKGKNPPKEPQPPEYTAERKKRQSRLDAKAERFLRRQEMKQRAIAGPAERAPINRARE